MSREMLIIRFPDGDAEFYSGSELPKVGDKLARRSADWIVARVSTHAEGGTAVIVMPAEVVRDASWPEPYTFIKTTP